MPAIGILQLVMPRIQICFLTMINMPFSREWETRLL